jgi:AraC-like DNA-binding protein
VALARLIRAAELFEQPGYSARKLAPRLGYSSLQSFTRHVRLLMGMTASQFRLTYTGTTMVAHYRATLIQPYREVLVTFDPLQSTRRPPC